MRDSDMDIYEMADLCRKVHADVTSGACTSIPRIGRCTCGGVTLLVCGECLQFLAATGETLKALGPSGDIEQIRKPPCCAAAGGRYEDMPARRTFTAPV